MFFETSSPLMLRLEMNVAIPLFPLYALVAWKQTTLSCTTQ